MMKSTSQNSFTGMARLALMPLLAVLLVSLSGKETVILNDDRDNNHKVAHAAALSIFKRADQDQLKSREEILRYLSNNLTYPSKARKSGHIGTVELYAQVSQDGTIKEVLEKQPDGALIEFDDVVIIGYSELKPEKTISSSHKTLVEEGRRVIESFPVLEIPEMYGQTMKFKFEFDLR